MDQRLYYPKTDAALYDEITCHLPKWGNGTTMHCSNVSIQCFRMMARVCRPVSILEIGFNLGHSCEIMFYLCSPNRIISVDINTAPDLLKARDLVAARHPGSFELITGDSKDPGTRAMIASANSRGVPFDLVYIDGDHSVEGVNADVELALSLGPRFIFFDDLMDEWGPGTIPAIDRHGLKVIAAQGNMCVCAPGVGYGWKKG